MNISQVKNYFKDKETTPCPLTEKLIKSGYQQTGGGYIEKAKQQGIEVDYKNAKPTQYWHLMEYCGSVDENKKFTKSIVCGELIFWMAEVSNAVSKNKLETLLDEIITSDITNRRKWNKKIQNLCFDKIAFKIESQ